MILSSREGLRNKRVHFSGVKGGLKLSGLSTFRAVGSGGGGQLSPGPVEPDQSSL